MICEIANLVFPERVFKERKIFLESYSNNNFFKKMVVAGVLQFRNTPMCFQINQTNQMHQSLRFIARRLTL